VLRVAEQFSGSDTGRQRRANEDSLLARSPLFVVADGMGGAQAGEVASRIAVEYFARGLGDDAQPEQALAGLAREANSRIHELSHTNAEQAGMGTTLTAVYVGAREVAIAHVGDSRAYCLRDGRLLRLTDDHSLVDELMRQGRLTPEEALEHPQRSVITRALGPEGEVEVDTRSLRGQSGDVYLICSDGLTTMISEQQIAELLLANPTLTDAGQALIAAANEAGGRDNITVLLLRLEDVGPDAAGAPHEHDTLTGLTAVAPQEQDAAPEDLASPSANGRDSTEQTLYGQPVLDPPSVEGTGSRRAPRRERAERAPGGPRRGRRAKRARTSAGPARPRHGLRLAARIAIPLAVLLLIGAGAYLFLQSVYFVGTNGRGLVTLYEGVPFKLPAGLNLYSSRYVSGVSASTIAPARRHTLLDHTLRSEGSAAELIRDLELGQLE
jgi:PPM family protein phosphatase